jgi:hypothetical protein
MRGVREERFEGLVYVIDAFVGRQYKRRSNK